jgi:hypothetical protein
MQWPQWPGKYVVVASVHQNKWQWPMSNKIYGSGQCPTKYMAVTAVSNKYMAVASGQQNMWQWPVSNKIYGSGQCPTKYMAVATVQQNVAVTTVSHKTYAVATVASVQQNKWQWPVSNKIYGSSKCPTNIWQWQQCPTKHMQ